MGWRPQPRFDKSRKSWYCRYRKKKHYLGVDYVEACRRFAEIVGRDDLGEAPETVAEAVLAWLSLHGKDWERFILKTWAESYGAAPLHRLGRDHLVEYRNLLQDKGQAVATVRHKVRMASRVCGWCVKSGYMDEAPEMPRLAKPVEKPRDVDAKTLSKAFADLPETARPILTFILETGCRPGEACKLKWSQVDASHGVCVLAEHKTGRNGSPAVHLPLTGRYSHPGGH